MSDHYAQREVYRGYTITIEYDDDRESPRDWDNLGQMVCWHRRYNLGDAHDWREPSDFDEWLAERKRERGRSAMGRNEGVIMLPLYLFDHSGLAMRTTDFGDRWDSGQVGYIYVTYEDVYKEYDCQRITAKMRERVEGVLRGEVATYSAFLGGFVYGYVISDGVDDHLDSCWGFYDGEGEYNGAYALKEARAVVDSRIARGELPQASEDEDEDEEDAAD